MGHTILSMDNVATLSPPPGPPGDDDIKARLIKIETQMEHVAKREDIARLETLIEKKETSILRWLLGILVAAMMAIAIALIRTFY